MQIEWEAGVGLNVRPDLMKMFKIVDSYFEHGFSLYAARNIFIVLCPENHLAPDAFEFQVNDHNRVWFNIDNLLGDDVGVSVFNFARTYMAYIILSHRGPLSDTLMPVESDFCDAAGFMALSLVRKTGVSEFLALPGMADKHWRGAMIAERLDYSWRALKTEFFG